MLEGWYCRSIANNNADVEDDGDDDDDDDDDEEDSPEEEVPNYKDQYRNLKRKLKFLIYENECFQEALRSTQRKLLKVNRDKSFLLDRLLQYEKVDASFSESDETESSDEELLRMDTSKRKKPEINVNNHVPHHPATAAPTIAIIATTTTTTAATTTTTNTTNPVAPAAATKPLNTSKKKKPTPKIPKSQNVPSVQSPNATVSMSFVSDGHMTPEEVERHLESRQTYLELVPEKAPPTVPTEMFSNDPSLDSESNEIGELETSPSNMGEDCLSVVDMMHE